MGELEGDESLVLPGSSPSLPLSTFLPSLYLPQHSPIPLPPCLILPTTWPCPKLPAMSVGSSFISAHGRLSAMCTGALVMCPIAAAFLPSQLPFCRRNMCTTSKRANEDWALNAILISTESSLICNPHERLLVKITTSFKTFAFLFSYIPKILQIFKLLEF